MAQKRTDFKQLHKLVKSTKSGAQKRAEIDYGQALAEIRYTDHAFLGNVREEDVLTNAQRGAITRRARSGKYAPDARTLRQIARSDDRPSIDYNQALKEIRTVDPGFMKSTARAYNCRLSKGQKSAITHRAREMGPLILGTFGQDVFTPPRRRGEKLKPYLARVTRLKADYVQEDSSFFGIHIQPPEFLSVKYSLARGFASDVGGADDNHIMMRAPDYVAVFTPPSVFPPSVQSVADDIRVALKRAVAMGSPESRAYSVSIHMRRSYISYYVRDILELTGEAREIKILEIGNEIMGKLSGYEDTTTKTEKVAVDGYRGMVIE